MLELSAKIREDTGKKVQKLREKGILPAILYGPKIKNLSLELGEKELEEIYQEAGETSIVKLKTGEKDFLVLIHEIQRNPVTDKITHIDFYQPALDEETEANIPLVFEGIAPAVKDLEGTLVKNITELEVKALPLNLPHEFHVNIEGLKTFEDNIMVKDIKAPEGVKILKEPEEIVVLVTPPEKVEEELEKPIEENVEEVEKAEEKKEEKEEEEAEEKKE